MLDCIKYLSKFCVYFMKLHFTKASLCLSVILLAGTVSASQIKSRKFDQNYSSYEYEQMELIQKDIKLLNHRLDKLTRDIENIKAKLNISPVNENTENRSNLSEDSNVKKPQNTNKVSDGSEKQIYDLALAALKSRDFVGATQKFEEFINDYSSSSLISNAHFWYGETFYKQKIYDKSALQFLKSYMADKKGPKAHESLIRLAHSLSELGKVKESCNVITKFKKEFPKIQESKMQKMTELDSKLNCKDVK